MEGVVTQEKVYTRLLIRLDRFSAEGPASASPAGIGVVAPALLLGCGWMGVDGVASMAYMEERWSPQGREISVPFYQRAYVKVFIFVL